MTARLHYKPYEIEKGKRVTEIIRGTFRTHNKSKRKTNNVMPYKTNTKR